MKQITDVEKTTINYFREFQGGFWLRKEGGEVYESADDGYTLCYREYLEKLLTELAKEGLPSLDLVLALISAARDQDDEWNVEDLFRGRMQFLAESGQLATGLDPNVGPLAIAMLEVVRALPDEYKSLEKMSLLVGTLFSGGDLVLNGEQAVKAVAEYSSGRCDVPIAEASGKLSYPGFHDFVIKLARANERFPDAETLITALRTGLTDVPDPAKITLPEPQKGDLLDELEEDNRTYGMAQLTRRLMAAIHIPLHSRGSSDLPFGGVSDITNRGDFDRLLLSELAYDDTTLMARLANNEALYLRREEPPQDLIEQRTVLIDTTLKMWGIPRVFAISAALACTITDQEDLAIAAVALGGESRQNLDLESKDGVVEALGMIDVAMDCGSALSLWGQVENVSPEQEVILVTHALQMKSPAFQAALAEVREKLDYLITVSREGQMQFFQYSGGRRKLLSQGAMDLKESLFAKRPVKRKKREQSMVSDGQMPDFYSERKSPLLFPTPGGRLDKKRTFAPGFAGILTILPNRRVLYWSRYAGQAAREVMSGIEPGEYGFGHDRNSLYSILVSNKQEQFLKLYTYNSGTDELHEIDLSDQITNWYSHRFRDGYFIFDMPGKEAYTRDYIVFDPETLAIANDKFSGTQITDLVYKGQQIDVQMTTQEIKMATNQGYSMVKKIRSVSVSSDGKLWVGKRFLRSSATKYIEPIEWIEDQTAEKELIYSERVGKTETYDADNSGEYFRRHVWSDGSQAIGDTRGFLHLISSDPKVSQISICMIVGVGTTVWAKDFGVVGNSIFRPAGPNHPEPEFYEKTIQAFIDVILEKCS